MKKNNEIKVLQNTDELFHFACLDFQFRSVDAINDKKHFSVVLSGGNTPISFFNILTSDDYAKNIPWDHIHFFFGDERYVPHQDERSNYHMAYEHLFSKVPVDSKNIYPIPTNFDHPIDAALDYEKTLREVFQIEKGDFPKFDLIYLGLGDDGHTASLMPFNDIVIKENQLVASSFITKLNMDRITLTPNCINHSQTIIFLVTGDNKASAASMVLEGEPDPLRYPAQLIHSIHGKTIWLMDEDAAKELKHVTKSRFS